VSPGSGKTEGLLIIEIGGPEKLHPERMHHGFRGEGGKTPAEKRWNICFLGDGSIQGPTRIIEGGNPIRNPDKANRTVKGRKERQAATPKGSVFLKGNR